MKALSPVAVASFLLSGCAELLAVSTVDELRASEFHVQLTSNNAAQEVTRCMKETLYSHQNSNGRFPYSAITAREFEKEQEISLRTGGATSLAGSEILFLITNSGRQPGVTRSDIWVHQRLMSGGGSRGYLDSLVGVIKPCVEGADSKRAVFQTSSESRSVRTQPVSTQSTDDSVGKLEKLKALHDRGVITREEFERKKKEILDSF